MVFCSFVFLFCFLPLVLLCYYIAPRQIKNLVLFLCSLLFYSWGEPVYIIIMLFSTLVDYSNGLLISYCRRKGNDTGAKFFLLASVIINIALLGIFKYSDFLAANLNQIFSLHLELPKLALPIGISFYTFQTMSYTIDVYRKKVDAQKNIITYGTYVSLFPQLIAGPIVRYKTIEKQLTGRTENISDFSYGIMRFMCGLGKKVLLANNIGILWKTVSGYQADNLPMLTAWLGILAFTFQIYFDFSGYSDMAVGLGYMFGFHFPENFNYPYISKSITEFWQRWHISLSSWFKDYVYIPLGGNRRGIVKQIRNILTVWLLTGFWHGAAWNFLLWGGYFACILIVEKLFLKKYLGKLPAFLRHAYAFLLIIGGWAIFAYPDMHIGGGYLKALLGLGTAGFFNTQTWYLFYTNLVLFFLLFLGSTRVPKKIFQKITDGKPGRKAVCESIFIVFVFIFSVAYLVDASYNPFLYFRF